MDKTLRKNVKAHTTYKTTRTGIRISKGHALANTRLAPPVKIVKRVQARVNRIPTGDSLRQLIQGPKKMGKGVAFGTKGGSIRRKPKIKKQKGITKPKAFIT